MMFTSGDAVNKAVGEVKKMWGPPVAAPSHAWKMKMNYEIFDFGKQKTEKWLTRGLFPYSDRSDQTAAVSVSAPDDAAQEIQRWEDSWEYRSVDILNEMVKWRVLNSTDLSYRLINISNANLNISQFKP